MFEIPEYVTLARQMAESLSGKRIVNGTLGNSPHKFVWYNRKPDEFAAIVKGKTTGLAYCRGRWLFIPIQPGYLLVFSKRHLAKKDLGRARICFCGIWL